MGEPTKPWWERFFGAGEENKLSWESLKSNNSSWSSHVLPWIDLAQGSNPDIPIVLPRLDAQGQPIWYCGGRSLRGTLQLRESMQAFLGPSYSDFDGRSYNLDPEDPVEAAFAECTVGVVYKVQPVKAIYVSRIQRAIDLYRGLLERMPSEQPFLKSPLRTLRAELDRALAVGDEARARMLLQNIRNIGRLDAENLLYVDVEVRARLANWEGIAWDRQLLSNLSGLRLPKRILLHVHEALYRVHVEPHEHLENPAAALQAFEAAKLHQWSALFGTRRGLQSTRLVKAFFLYELTREHIDHTGLARLSEALKQTGERFADSLLTLLPPADTPGSRDSPLVAADEAFLDSELDRALDLYLQAPPSPKRWSQLVRCAEEIGTQEAARQIIESVDSYGISNVPRGLARKLDSLRERCSGGSKYLGQDGWLSWAKKVQYDMSPDKAMSVLREHAATWAVDELVNKKELMDEFADIINKANGSADIVFREAAALIYQSLMPESGAPSRFVKPLLQLFVTRVALFDDPSQNELELVRDITEAILTIGAHDREYESLLSDLGDLIDTQMSPQLLPWSLDIAELLALQRCPDPESRLRFVLRVLEDCKRMSHRLHQSDILVVEQLCRDLSIDCPIQRGQPDNVQHEEIEQILANKKIAIYTLVESAGQRAAEALKQLCPSVQVDLNCDHECTEALASLARSADLFVFAWKCSKHQAFYCIKKYRNPEKPLIQPEGKGASSILRAVLADV